MVVLVIPILQRLMKEGPQYANPVQTGGNACDMWQGKGNLANYI